jgi:ATP-dependent DNA helicase DinG
MTAPTPHEQPSAAARKAENALAAVCSHLPGAEAREGQREMVRLVADAIATGEHTIIAAGTGTGKSLGYLIPVALSGKRAVVATATKSLQDQLAGKDLPFLDESLPGGVTYAVLKGRSNYLCMQRLRELNRARGGQLDGMGDGADPDQIDYLTAWSRETTTGDRADLDQEPTPATWAAVSVGPRECPGASKCPSGDECFAEAAREHAAAADIVVVNTHLYGIHLGSDGVILPPHEVLVVDEAHVLEEVVSATMGVELTSGRVHHAARTIASLSTDVSLPAMLEAASASLASELGEYSGEQLDVLPHDLNLTVNLIRTQVDNGLALVRKIPDSEVGDVTSRKARAINALTGLIDDLDTINAPSSGSVRFVEGTGSSASLRVAPVEVDRVLADTLWDSSVTAVLTSATIPPLLAERLGMGADIHTVDVGSPFDYAHQALLYCAAHMPDPRTDRFQEELHTELDRLIRAAGGRTLALFTSRRAMEAAHSALDGKLPFKLYLQGDLPKPLLVSRFAEEASSCLFATMGFWQGIDVPGPTLSLVTIDKLPFARPNDPLIEARRSLAGPNAFRLIDLPRAATLLAQGVGRLIRTSTDRGVVAVFDPRLANNKSYRWELISALPPMRRTKSREETIEFLREIRKAAEAGAGEPGDAGADEDDG